MFNKISILVLVIMFVGGCKKSYPDDHQRHFKSPTERITAHSWIYEKHENIPPYSFSFATGIQNVDIELNKSGECSGGSYDWPYIDVNGNPSDHYIFDFNGRWEFVENENKIKVIQDSNNYTIWTIQELDRTEFVISNEKIKYYFKK